MQNSQLIRHASHAVKSPDQYHNPKAIALAEQAALVREIEPLILSCIGKLKIRDSELRADVHAEAWAAILRDRHQIKYDAAFTSWVWTVTRNAFRTILQRYNAKKRGATTELVSLDAMDNPDGILEPALPPEVDLPSFWLELKAVVDRKTKEARSTAHPRYWERALETWVEHRLHGKTATQIPGDRTHIMRRVRTIDQLVRELL